MSENRSGAPMRVSVVGPQWLQLASTSRGSEVPLVETADVGLLYLHFSIIPVKPRIQVGEPTPIDADR